MFRNQISDQMVALLRGNFELQSFINGFCFVIDNILIPSKIPFQKFVANIKEIRDETSLSCKLFAYCKSVVDLAKENEFLRKLPCTELANQLVNNNKIGSIVFISAEVAPWTVVGGLGVMVQELTQGLAKLREDVILISPYYDKIKKGDSNYLYWYFKIK